MNYVILDTSSGIRVLLCANGKNYNYTDENGKTASTVLLPVLDKLLNDAQITISNIDMIFAVVGPGSFTGIRIAVNTARMISYVHSIAIKSIDTLSLGAHSVEGKCKSVVCGWGKNFYVADYDENKNLIGEPYTATSEELEKTDGLLVCDKKSVQILGNGVTYDVSDALRKVALYKIENNITENLTDVVPFYVTVSQAERELAQKEKDSGSKGM